MYDIIIKNGKIIDGTGNPGYFSDIAIKDGKITSIAKDLNGAKEVINASGLVVTPGFIDSHSHSDGTVLTFPDQIEKTEQGITTSIGGMCGISAAPLERDFSSDSDEVIGTLGKKSEILKTFKSFVQTASKLPQGSNIALFVGHGAIRSAVMGLENRKPTDEELEKMKEMAREALSNGAIGLSFGLIYTPGCYADTDELIELAKVAKEYNALISAHIRNEGDFLAKSTEEFIKIVKESGVRAILSHHKAMLKENWGKVSHTLRMIDEANASGCEIYLDTYPYNASSTGLSARFIPKELRTGGNAGLSSVLKDKKTRDELKKLNIEKFGEDLSWVLVLSCKAYPEYEGMRVSEIEKLHKKDGYDVIFDILEHSFEECMACFFTTCEEDIKTVLAHPRTMICTDSAVAGNSKAYHPRLRGSFPRVLGKYVREEKVTPLYDMIRKMTSLPATVYGLKGKGFILEGFDADICIFDSEKIIDNADYTACEKRADGLNFVLLNGEIVVENAVYNGKRMGKVILN